jgi:hypothetical protein
MLDEAQLIAQIQPHTHVLVICPRRCGKSTFAASFLNERGGDNAVYMGLTSAQRDVAQALLTTGALCLAGTPRNADERRRALEASTLVVDEALFYRFELLGPFLQCGRVLAISSQSVDAQALQPFVDCGFAVIQAPLLQAQ